MALSTKGIPYWDQSALLNPDSPSSTGGKGNKPISRQLAPGLGTGSYIAPGIISALPEDPNDPWPEELSIWDTIKLGGMRAPGLARVEGGRGRRIPNMVIPGASGSAADFLGEDPVEFYIHLTIWTPKQWKWLQLFIAAIAPPLTALIRPVAVKVDYPALAMLNIYDVYVMRIALPHIDEYQRGRIEIHCTEFLPFLNVGTGQVQPGADFTTSEDGKVTIQPRPMPASPLTTSLGTVP